MKKKDYIVPQIAVEEIQTESSMLTQSPTGDARVDQNADGLGYHDVLVRKETSTFSVWDEEW